MLKRVERQHSWAESGKVDTTFGHQAVPRVSIYGDVDLLCCGFQVVAQSHSQLGTSSPRVVALTAGLLT